MRNDKAFAWVMLAALLWAGTANAGAPESYFTEMPTNPAAVWNDATPVVTGVVAFSPAEEAGISEGDRVIGLSNWRIRTPRELNLAAEFLARNRASSLYVVRDGRVISVPLGEPDKKGGLGLKTASAGLSAVRVAFESLGIKPSEYLGVAQGGRDDGGALEAAIANYALTNSNHRHPVLVQFSSFPPRAVESISALAEAQQPGVRARVLGLLKAHYALIESRWDDAKRHIAEAGLLSAPTEPFLDGLAAFYSKLANTPPDGTRGVDLQRYGVTPEYFAMCYPAPVLPLKLHDWSNMSQLFAADFARRADALPWDEQDRNRAAQREFRSLPKVGAADYLRMIRGAMVYPELYGGYPTRYAPLFKTGSCAALLEELKVLMATNTPQRELVALALIAPSAILNDTNAFRQAMTVLRDAGSRELGLANYYAGRVWITHESSSSHEGIDAVLREVNDSVGIPAVYRWFAGRSRAYAEALKRGWYFLAYEGLLDGTEVVHTAETVKALGGPQELVPSSAKE